MSLRAWEPVQDGLQDYSFLLSAKSSQRTRFPPDWLQKRAWMPVKLKHSLS